MKMGKENVIRGFILVVGLLLVCSSAYPQIAWQFCTSQIAKCWGEFRGRSLVMGGKE